MNIPKAAFPKPLRSDKIRMSSQKQKFAERCRKHPSSEAKRAKQSATLLRHLEDLRAVMPVHHPPEFQPAGEIWEISYFLDFKDPKFLHPTRTSVSLPIPRKLFLLFRRFKKQITSS